MFGRALAYQPDSADLYLAGGGGSMYRLNLEQGRFLNSLDTAAPAINCLATSPEHGLVCGGTTDGRVTCWDPRTRSLAGSLDVALAAVTEDTAAGTVPAVTAITHRSGLSMAVGTSTGQVLLYDLRSSKPLLVKDHMYGLPIKKVVFAGGGEEEARVLSVDSQVVRIWARETGKAYTSIEATADFNDLEMCPRSGLMFLANEQPRMQVFNVPSLGPTTTTNTSSTTTTSTTSTTSSSSSTRCSTCPPWAPPPAGPPSSTPSPRSSRRAAPPPSTTTTSS